MNYVAPRWLPGGNLQTIWPALYSRRVNGAHPHYRRERWTTPDADFIDVDYLTGTANVDGSGQFFDGPPQVLEERRSQKLP